MLSLQRAAGNAAVSGLIARNPIAELVDEARAAAEMVATGFGLSELRLGGSVGRRGANRPVDVAHVRARLVGVGYAPGPDLEGLAAAIERYQREVVHSRHPDGRIDPGGPTVRALNAAHHRHHTAGGAAIGAAAPATAPARPAAAGPPKAESAASGAATHAPVAAGPQPDTLGATAGAKTPDTTAATGPRVPLAADLEGVLGPLTGNPAVAEVAKELAELQQLAPTVKKDGTGSEEVGTGRRKLVDKIKTLREKVGLLDHAGLPPDVLARIKPLIYRAIDDVSPYYFQSTNIDILEPPPPDQTRTCNITSVSMALEALGKSPADYNGDKSVIEAIAQVYQGKVGEAQGRVGSDLSGLRMPDYLELAAIAHNLGKKPAQTEEIKAAAVQAWDSILNVSFLVELAQRFGVSAHHQYFNLQGGGKKPSDQASALRKYGDARRSLTEHQVDIREFTRKLETATGAQKKDLEKRIERAKKSAEKFQKQLDTKLAKGTAKSEASMDEQLSLADYKRSVTQGIQPQLDAGNQVVVSLAGHYTRLQALGDEFIVIDDPGQWTRSNRHVTWSEARAMGYFWIWIVIGS